MCNTSNFKYFPCVVWILTTEIPALSSDSQNNLMYGFPPNSRPGRDSTLSDEHRIFAAAAFTEHFPTFLCLVPTETLLKVHAGVREGLPVPRIGRVFRSDEHRIFAAAAFTEHFPTFLCLVPTETLLKVHAGVREGLPVPRIGRVVRSE